ncbi:hypothetical protein OHC33_008773 [Knufia fluminis]|uniref:CHY-type domain-containing protein n=1 Tax=Knufia fluminis TaxID=191047 RepID=A0AAN8EA49_9EURO|nr:hypothetical protein OHC33_008773 [Knufia fluminis]
MGLLIAHINPRRETTKSAHSNRNSPAEIARSAESGNTAKELAHASSHDTRQSHTTRPSSAVANVPVPKPVSRAELENPREYQISQVIRRYSPFRADLGEATTLKFRLNPTDPDFPFELETGLHCVLTVPTGFPSDGKPRLAVQNPEMVRGFQINVEKGFDDLVSRYPSKSLLGLLNELDKHLEKYLTSQKAATIKLVANKRSEATIASYEPEAPKVAPAPFVPILSRYSNDELQQARARRDAELKQLEARLGRSELFSKAGDGVAFNVPLQVPSSSAIPVSLRSLRETALIVPEVYPLEPCTIVLRGVEGPDAENVEVAFEKRAVEKKDQTLMAHINYLTQNLAKLAIDPRPAPVAASVVDEDEDGSAVVSTTSDQPAVGGAVRDPSRPHLRYMSRPPEWSNQQNEAGSIESDTSDDESEDDSDEDIESIVGGAAIPSTVTSGLEKGVQLSFPGLELIGIELLQVVSLSLSVRCGRCKEQADIRNVIPAAVNTSNIHRTETCQKCSAMLVVSYRSDLMHAASSKAGYLDVENCTITELLPSAFQPTCSECSTAFPSPPGVTAVRGDSPLTICRSCHAKMTFKIPELKFLRVSTAESSAALPLRARKPKEDLGISAGTPLPDNGKCQHYSRSYRWFRFSCCNRVFPCDKCHDSPTINPAQKDNAHPNEHAERMICGFCSREQRYHPEACRHCGRSVIKKSITTGFWEGGKGTRDKNLMRKKEGRKYKVSGKEKKDLNKKKVESKGKGGMWWPG